MARVETVPPSSPSSTCGGGTQTRRPVYEAAKRLLDLSLAVPGLVLLAPLFGLIALAIRLDSRGPVFFRQDRAGLAGRRFRLVKFRTMSAGARSRGSGGEVLVDAPQDPADPAITPVGRLLRATSLDELPQLLNVARGDMSLVGPRPTIPQQVEAYGPRERGRLSVPPGLTGLAQIHGRNTLSWPERIEIDLDYVRRRGFLLDLGILLATPWTLVTGRGIYRG